MAPWKEYIWVWIFKMNSVITHQVLSWETEAKRHHHRWKCWLDSAKKTHSCSQSHTWKKLSNTSAALTKLFLLQLSQQGLISYTSNSDASCDESLKWENWKTIIWTWQFSLAGQSSLRSCCWEPSLWSPSLQNVPISLCPSWRVKHTSSIGRYPELPWILTLYCISIDTGD